MGEKTRQVMDSRIDELEDMVERYKAALEKYADKKSWIGMRFVIWVENGPGYKIACDALEVSDGY